MSRELSGAEVSVGRCHTAMTATANELAPERATPTAHPTGGPIDCEPVGGGVPLNDPSRRSCARQRSISPGSRPIDACRLSTTNSAPDNSRLTRRYQPRRELPASVSRAMRPDAIGWSALNPQQRVAEHLPFPQVGNSPGSQAQQRVGDPARHSGFPLPADPTSPRENDGSTWPVARSGPPRRCRVARMLRARFGDMPGAISGRGSLSITARSLGA
jgi:hypothetical protein